jgi:hypothetical protein
MPKGNVEAKVFAIDGPVPKMARKTGYTRKGEIDEALETAAAATAVGGTVCIRQYDKKESASGTLYNLRKRQKADPPVNEMWSFELGDLGQLDVNMEGKIGLFATRTA